MGGGGAIAGLHRSALPHDLMVRCERLRASNHEVAAQSHLRVFMKTTVAAAMRTRAAATTGKAQGLSA
jgi:hypothetical protein